jgi:hypothetical protein
MQALLLRNPVKLSRDFNVPIFANQWGIKRSVDESSGRLR